MACEQCCVVGYADTNIITLLQRQERVAVTETNFSSAYEQEKLYHSYVMQKICRDTAQDLRI